MSRLPLIPLGAAGALVLSMFGCGGIDGADGLFDRGSVGAGGAAATTSSATGSTATTSSATTSSSDATSANVTTGASTSSVSASASGSSSSTGGGNNLLACGGTTCPLGDQNACCWSKFGMPMASGACVQGPIASDGCKTFVGDGGLQSRLECQTSAQCDQGVCCGHRTFFNGQNFFYDLVSCLDTCDKSDVTLCDPANPADVCPMIATQNGPVQGVCKQSSSLPPGYFVCTVPG